MINKPLILVVDDEQAILDTLKASLEDEGFIVETVNQGHDVLLTIGRLVPDLVLLDIFLPMYNGLELLAQIKKEYPRQHVIMISGFGTIPIATQALRNGATDFIEKPLNLDEILTKILFIKNKDFSTERALHTVQYKTEQYKSASDIEIVGESSLFYELINHAALIAPIKEPVLIYGPSGSGKSLIAQFIHARSNSDQKFITINGAMISELLPKHFDNDGTLYIKNIEFLNEQTQKNLLAFIDEYAGKIRIIASTASNLFKLVQAGAFNKSLFCKLNQTPVEIPSINKRRYDIPLLVEYFLQKANSTYNKKICFDSSAIRSFRNYDWEQDVSQINTFVDAIVKNCPQRVMELFADDIACFFPEQKQEFIQEQLFSKFNSLQQATDAFQQRYLAHLLKTYRYDITQLAEFLQIPVAQLHDKMIQLHINVQ